MVDHFPNFRGHRRTDNGATTELCEVMNTIRDVARTGSGRRLPPGDFPPWQTVTCWIHCVVPLLAFCTIRKQRPELEHLLADGA
jgi:transposase